MAHNGGRSQINPSFLYYNNEYLYCDRMKSADKWNRNDNTTPYDVTKHDADGYMHTLYGGGEYLILKIPSQSARPGEYILDWEGGGTLNFSGASSSSTSPIVGTPNSNSIRIDVTGVTADGVNYPHNIRFYHVDDAALIAADPNAFSPYAKAKYAKIGSFRWHDPQLTNDGNNIAKWAHRMPLTHFSYVASRYIEALYAGDSTNSGDDYTVDPPSGWVLEDKAVLHVRWNADGTTTTPTLTVTGEAVEIPILDHQCSPFPFSDNRKPKTGRNATLVYDADLASFIMHGGNFSYYDMGLTGGMPVEHIVKFCNEVGCHLWFSFPHYACDPVSDYVTNTINYIRDNLNAGLVAKYEVSNELWNSSAFYTQTYYARAKEKAKYPAGPSDDDDNWVGRALALVGKAVHDAYSGDTSRYDVICACGAYAGSLSSYAPRMESTNFLSEPGGFAAKTYVTKGSVANYWHSSFAGTATEATMATEWASATDARKLELVNEYVTSEAGSSGFSLNNCKARLLLWRDWFAAYDCGLEPYEGGYDYGWSDGTGDTNAFTQACYSAPALYRQTQLLYQYCVSLGITYPSQYNAVGSSNFSTHHPDIYADPEPTWLAIEDFSNNKLQFLFTTS